MTKGPFTTADDVVRRAREVLELVAAIPTSVVPDHADRERLTRSDTPLAYFADVRTPEQAMARLQTMDLGRRAQLLALFNR